MSTAFHLVGEVETDSRRRISLASLRLSSGPGARYRVEEGPKGELRLIPVFSLTADELELLGNPTSMMRINENLAAAEAGEVDDFDPVQALARLDRLDAGEDT